MVFRVDIFGPDSYAKVTIVNGSATSLEIIHPNRKSSIVLGGDWVVGLVGTDDEILSEVARNLNGATVIKA